MGDFEGLIMAKAGGTALLTPAANIYAALERGVIDTAEWASVAEGVYHQFVAV